MNACPKMVKRYCSICWEPFYVIADRGTANRTRCDLHVRPNSGRLSKADLRLVPAQPCTGVAILRQCRGCGTAFLARDEAARYCGLDCYVEHNCHKKVTR